MNLLFRILAVGDIVLVTLTWSTWFEGSKGQPGFADRVFRNVRVSGFRPDFVWLVISIPIFLAIAFYSIRAAREDRAEFADAGLGIAAALANCLAIFWMLSSGLLYFG